MNKEHQTPNDEHGFEKHFERCRAIRAGEVNWGQWRYDPKYLVLKYDTGDVRYEIDLERCTTSAEILDWVFQIAGKPWADDSTTANVVRALNDLIGQGVCSFGVERGPLDIRKQFAGDQNGSV